MKKETGVPGEFDPDRAAGDAADRAFDRLLRESRPAGGPGESIDDTHIESEALAAWAEGALDAGDEAAIERHLAECARCQEVAAAFARTAEPTATHQTTPATPAVVMPFRPRRVWRWVAPIAAAAAATVVWIAWPPRDSATVGVAPVDSIARVTPAPEMPVPRAPAQTQQGQSAAEAKPAAQSGVAVLPDAPGRRSAKTAQATASPAPVTSPEPVAAPPPPPPALPPPTPPAATPTPIIPTVTTPTPIAPPATTAPPPVVVGGIAGGIPPATADAARRASQVALAQTPVAIVVAEFSSPRSEMTTMTAAAGGGTGAAGAAGGRGGGGGGGRGGAGRGGGARAAAESRAPTPAMARWRVLASGAVERSDDAVSWVPIAIDPPVVAIGGAAPSPTVCWLIGRGGVVLLSTDGRTFRRVTSPTIAEIVSIRATSAREASVTTADGRVLVTTDAGVTWRLQGSPTSSF
jgi:hypothetical protein